MAGIASVMETELVTAGMTETVTTAAIRMSRNNVGALLVLDGERLVGLVSERDLVSRVVAARRDAEATTVGQICTRDVVTIDVNEPLKSVLSVFRDQKFRHLPVARNGKPVGILSARDFHRFLVEGFERYVSQLKYERALAEGEDPYDHFGGQYER
jgi:CBS domain-containing protein